MTHRQWENERQRLRQRYERRSKAAMEAEKRHSRAWTHNIETAILLAAATADLAAHAKKEPKPDTNRKEHRTP